MCKAKMLMGFYGVSAIYIYKFGNNRPFLILLLENIFYIATTRNTCYALKHLLYNGVLLKKLVPLNF